MTSYNGLPSRHIKLVQEFRDNLIEAVKEQDNDISFRDQFNAIDDVYAAQAVEAAHREAVMQAGEENDAKLERASLEDAISFIKGDVDQPPAVPSIRQMNWFFVNRGWAEVKKLDVVFGVASKALSKDTIQNCTPKEIKNETSVGIDRYERDKNNLEPYRIFFTNPKLRAFD